MMKIYKFSFESPNIEFIDEKLYIPVDENVMYVLYKYGVSEYDVEVNAKKVGVMDKSGHIFLKNELKN